MTNAADDPLPLPVKTLLDLFTAELHAVRFPDLDHQVLEKAAAEVRARAEELARAEAAAEAARTALQASQEAMLQKGQRALAYARIYAEDNPELTAKLDGIALPRSQRRATRELLVPDAPAAAPSPPRRRGRPSAQGSPPLFDDGAAPAIEAERAG
jgi:hypothetical protein